jgi:peptidoglycan/LPS O-acetylase OafA/YrhL
MCVPAVILAGLGGLFYYQMQTGDWTSWSYMWALIPGFVGIGIILSALLERKWHSMKAGFDLVFISAVLYLVLASIFGGLTLLGPYGPAVLLILLGVYILIRGAISSRNKHITG